MRHPQLININQAAYRQAMTKCIHSVKARNFTDHTKKFKSSTTHVKVSGLESREKKLEKII